MQPDLLEGIGLGALSLTAAAILETQVHPSAPAWVCFVPCAAVLAGVVSRSRPVPSGEPSLGLEVKPSVGRGDGVFCTSPILAGAYIASYLGEALTKEGFETRYGPEGRGVGDGPAADYCVELNGPLGLDPSYVDGAAPALSNQMRYANHGKTFAERNMVRVWQRWPTREMKFFASKDIAAGEELLWEYDPAHWDGREDMIR